MAGFLDYLNGLARSDSDQFARAGQLVDQGQYGQAIGAEARGLFNTPIATMADVARTVIPPVANIVRGFTGDQSTPVTPTQPAAPAARASGPPAPISFNAAASPAFGDYLKIRGTPAAPQATAPAPQQYSAMQSAPGVSYAPGVTARPAQPGITYQQALALHQLAQPTMPPIQQTQDTLGRMAAQQYAYDKNAANYIANLKSLLFGVNYELIKNAQDRGGYPE